MKTTKKNIYIFADWLSLKEPKLMGILSALSAKSKKAFSFQYDSEWMKTENYRLIDPDIQFYTGLQFPNNKENFGVFFDSMPDTWGRTLMKRKVAHLAREKNEKAPNLYDIDYLLGIDDRTRMGALRFKTEIGGEFLNNDIENPTPPWSSIRELESAVRHLERDESADIKKSLAILMAPGSSLGGARPKANVVDEEGNLWIAKFPSKNDAIDKGAWEYLAYRLATDAGIEMSESKIERVSSSHHTFFTKRFDRQGSGRIHFASAMTMTGNNEETIKTNPASYLDIAEFITNHGCNVKENLEQLWRRIVFNIAVSNTDDHLRNHGFLLTEKGWILSPAYDINPSVEKNGLAINISTSDNSLDIELAKSVGEYFRLSNGEMNKILDNVQSVVKNWATIAEKIGITRKEQEMMASAFITNN